MPKVIINEAQVNAIWEWLITNISNRPDAITAYGIIDDHKLWILDLSQPLLSTDEYIEKAAQLYLISQIGDITEILKLSKKECAFDLIITTQKLDDDVRVVIESDERFRDGLSEHLGFWTNLATLVKLNRFKTYSISQPNFQPEDKGPDGLFLGLNENQEIYIELRSIKNSIISPYYLVASAKFRNGGDAQKKKQIEEYYLLIEEEYGFSRLDRLLSQVSNFLNLELNTLTRAVLLKTAISYNAIVVADEAHYTTELFNGYQRISTNPENRIGTYIGSDNWAQFSENVRNKVIHILQTSGVW